MHRGGDRRADARNADRASINSFLLALSDRLRTLDDPVEIQRVAMEETCAQLAVNRALYVDVDAGRGEMRVGPAVLDGAPPMPTLLQVRDFGEFRLQYYLRGEPLIVDDAEGDPRLDEPLRSNFAALGVRAAVGMPLLRAGELAALVAVHCNHSRAWTGEDVLLLREVAERTWAMAERAAAVRELHRQRERQDFLLSLGDAMRPLADPHEIKRVAAACLGRHLGASRVAYAEHLDGQGAFLVGRNYVDGAGQITGQHDYATYGRGLLQALRSGAVHVQPDIAADADLDDGAKAALAAAGIGASLLVPLVKAGRLVGFLGVSHAGPHVFSADEVDLVREVAERTWAALEQGKAQAALRTSEQYFDALVLAGAYSVFRVSADWSCLYRLDSRALQPTTAPDEAWLDRYIVRPDQEAMRAEIARAVSTRTVFELEHRTWRADGSVAWMASRAVPILGPDGQIREWFGAANDVSERHAAVERLRTSEEGFRDELQRQVLERTAALAHSRDQLRATMDSSMDMIQVFQAVRDGSDGIVDFRWVLLNHTARDRMGDLTGKLLLETNPGVVADGIFETFKRVTETGEADVSEFHYGHEGFDNWFFQSTVKLGDGFAATTKDVTEWRAAQARVRALEDEVTNARLRDSEARAQVLVEGLALASWETDGAGAVVEPSRSWMAHTGQSFAEMQCDGWLDAAHPDCRPALLAEWREALAVGKPLDCECRLRNHDADAWCWSNVRAAPVRDGNGAIVKWVAMAFDIHKRRAAEDDVRASENRLRLATDVGRLGLCDWDIGSDEMVWSDGFHRLCGDPGQLLRPSRDAWLARIHPEDRAHVEAQLSESRRSGRDLALEYRMDPADGDARWLAARCRFLYADAPLPVRMICAITDVTEQREWDRTQATLIGELQHRTRNLMGVVRALAERSIRASAGLDDFRERFGARIDALARTQSLLSRLREHARVSFDELVESELGAVLGTSRRVTWDGPPGVRLRSSTVQALAMALHELATNASKYGALSQPGARLHVHWDFERDGPGGHPWLHIDWRETGVRLPAEPLQLRPGGGQGRLLIEQALPYQIKARVDYKLVDGGLHCRIDVPVSQTREEVV